VTNDQSILERIAQSPNCRAVQLADWLDAALEDVQAALAALIAVGDVAVTAGKSPAGTPCSLYDLTEAFKASKAYEPILAKTLAVQFAAFRPDLGKTDRAVEFVRERGMATSAELHAVLGLAPEEYASTYLRSAINSGRLLKDGKAWTLGAKEAGQPKQEAKPAPQVAVNFPAVAPTTRPAAPAPAPAPAAVAKPDALETGAELGRIEKPPLPVPTFAPVAAPSPAPAVAPFAPRYRYALWSDGQVEIQRNGMQLAVLPRAAADEFADFLRGAV
jgi:hypothetical protein